MSRRRDKIITYVPFLVGFLYFAVISELLTTFDIDFEQYKIVVVLIWVGFTVCSSLAMGNLILLWDKNDNEED
jgi:hypothetical protein